LSQPSSKNLTIVAHGPLNRLSFASLRDPSGRYLIENHVLAYAPSASLLGRDQPALPGQTLNLGFLLVADPAPMPDAPAGITLPALPGANSMLFVVARNEKGVPVAMHKIINPVFPAAFELDSSSLIMPDLLTRGLYLETQLNTHGQLGVFRRGDLKGELSASVNFRSRGAALRLDRLAK